MYSYELYIQNTKKHTALKLRWQLRFLGVRKIMKHPKLSGLLKIYQNLSNHKVYDKEGHKQKTYLKRNMFSTHYLPGETLLVALSSWTIPHLLGNLKTSLCFVPCIVEITSPPLVVRVVRCCNLALILT